MACTRLIWIVSLVPGAMGCGTDPLVCTAEFVQLRATVVNRTAQTLPSPIVQDTVLRTNAVLDIVAEPPSEGVPEDGVRDVIIFSDAFKDAIRAAGESVTVGVTAGDYSVQARYTFGSNGCHVQKLAGPDTLEVE